MHMDHLLREKPMGHRENPELTLISHEFTHSFTEINTHTHTHTHWVSQKVHSGFSVKQYGKPQMNFLPNPIYIIDICRYIYTGTHMYMCVYGLVMYQITGPGDKILNFMF